MEDYNSIIQSIYNQINNSRQTQLNPNDFCVIKNFFNGFIEIRQNPQIYEDILFVGNEQDCITFKNKNNDNLCSNSRKP